MNFLLDAQLPRRLAHRLRETGYDALHTLDLPNGNRTTDREILAIAEGEHRVVVTKDADFVNSFLVARRPSKLLLISTGNIANRRLDEIFTAALPLLVRTFAEHDFVELSQAALVVHA